MSKNLKPALIIFGVLALGLFGFFVFGRNEKSGTKVTTTQTGNVRANYPQTNVSRAPIPTVAGKRETIGKFSMTIPEGWSTEKDGSATKISKDDHVLTIDTESKESEGCNFADSPNTKGGTEFKEFLDLETGSMKIRRGKMLSGGRIVMPVCEKQADGTYVSPISNGIVGYSLPLDYSIENLKMLDGMIRSIQ